MRRALADTATAAASCLPRRSAGATVTTTYRRSYISSKRRNSNLSISTPSSPCINNLFVGKTFRQNDATSLSSHLQRNGYVPTTNRLLTPEACHAVRERMPCLFRGEFETGIYPDEWHWREGISRDDAAREMCNSWKADRTISSVVLHHDLGRWISAVMGWSSVRIAQDDLVWKPPSTFCTNVDESRIDTVGFHQDSAYISVQFEPYQNNSVTLWIALDDADEENGCIEYAAGSHKWEPILHLAAASEGENALETESEISSFHSSDATSYRDGLSKAAALSGVNDPLATIKAVPVKEGYAILHHQDSWHGSGPNKRGSRHRRALVAHYIRGDVSFTSDASTGPFGRASYIYGRYKRYNSVELDESFFPIIYGDEKSGELTRTPWLDSFLA